MSHRNTSVSAAIRHPDFMFDAAEWAEWRDTFEGGKRYRDLYLKKQSNRETPSDFALRKFCTPIPTFAKAAIIDIRNAIFQRLMDVIRTGGSPSYNRAIKGEGAGVDREGSSMDNFIGIDVLTELLIMGRTGIYVDAPDTMPTTLAQQQMLNTNLAPYCYSYRIEDILSWKLDHKEVPGTFRAVLLRDHVESFTMDFGDIELPDGRDSRLRLVWKDPETGKVRVKMFTDEMSKDKRKIIPFENGDPDGGITLDIDVVPFIMPSIGDALMKDICTYQHAILNLVSWDANWLLQSSSPFLTIQRERRSAGAHLKQPGQGNTAEGGGQRSKENEEQIGGKGRYYDKEMDRPGYIAPPTDPLMASTKVQEKWEDDIRKLVNLAIANKAGSRTESAEAKKLSSQGLEAGLSYIGLVLEHAERTVAKFWAAYENDEPANVKYPERYVLKQDIDRIEEASKLAELMDRIPSTKARKELAKQIVETLLGGRSNTDTLRSMLQEIEQAGYTTGNVKDVIAAHQQGLVSDETASTALGYGGVDEVEQARKDKAERAAITLLAQTSLSGESGQAAIGAGARGVPEIDPNEDSATEEKEEADGE